MREEPYQRDLKDWVTNLTQKGKTMALLNGVPDLPLSNNSFFLQLLHFLLGKV